MYSGFRFPTPAPRDARPHAPKRWGPPPPLATSLPGGIRNGGRDAVSTETKEVHRQPRARRTAGNPRPEREVWGGGAPEGNGVAGSKRRLGQSLHLGGRRRELRLRLPQPRKRGGFRLMAKRPSDRRSPGRNPGPQGAFEVSMINVSCNSH